MSKFINFIHCLIFSLLTFGILIHELVEAKANSNADASIIKTIKSENDEIIDCYDMRKQPAFNNPLFRNHMIQMKPCSYPKGVEPKDQVNLIPTQTWQKYGLCPEGTVPIRRRSGKNYQPNPISSSKRLPQPYSNNVVNTNDEFAIMSPVGEHFQGAKASINVWKPLIEKPEEYSHSQIWISGEGNKEVIEAGWAVNKNLYGDEQPRIFVYWTVDNYNKTGCFNIQCSGFVQTTSKVSLGSSFNHISTFNGNQYSITFIVFKEQSTGNWWVQVGGITVGYWPHFLFKQLSIKATKIVFGGQISNTRPNGRHTNTQMGSGHFPSEGGYGISSYFHKVKYLMKNTKPKSL